MSLTTRSHPTVALLRQPACIRSRCHALLALAEQGALPHFSLHLECMDATADYVVDTIRQNYPDLRIPYHARWRHFAAGGIDRWGRIAATLAGEQPADIARRRFDLAIVAVLLDAGAGPRWRYCDTRGEVLARSEGLGVASLEAFSNGLFSADPDDPLRVDAEALESLDAARLGHAFQHAERSNPLAGLEGRAALMRNLGAALRAAPEFFGAETPRPGGLFDILAADARPRGLPAENILALLLEALAPVWPRRLTLHGENLGDVWHHPLAAPGGPGEGLVPFHKLSQWMSYSLAEVLEDAGIPVLALDALTGLPEYRNGGLFLDLGVLALRDPSLSRQSLPVDHPAIVEWRALTVALLDRLAQAVRDRLGLDAAALPLARVLEGGSWAAGRRIARELRPDGAPPLTVASDGTVF
ncbi:URC4/urg3 family protein [Roseomonas sp. 18066]|uniref:URC4/urg3 family protein n=1 Tax=Roseomonas sp. 18066 TaxID=2681412 RepID=UPI001F29EF15|nr:URC4/urg3 family protein [Roseomonas sp. 18066]